MHLSACARVKRRSRLTLLLAFASLIVCNMQSARKSLVGSAVGNRERILVTVAYAENLGNGGVLDRHNLEYFFQVALTETVPGTIDIRAKVDYIIVVNGELCTPCDVTLRYLIDSGRVDPARVNVLYRSNVGMDFGAYSEAVKYVQYHKPLLYAYFVFLNSSLRGPFMPKWTPRSFHFTDTLIDFMRADHEVKLVSSFVSCLHTPEPLPGPVAESLFFAVSRDALSWLQRDGVLDVRQNKSDVILNGEYGLMHAILKRGYKAENLLSRYGVGLDWSDTKHHLCNDCRHSSRRGSLEGGISASPFETIFVKASWCVRSAEIGIMSSWFTRLASGAPGTEGFFDEDGWRRGISVEGTSGKLGTLPPDVPMDDCPNGNFNALLVNSAKIKADAE